MVNFNESEGNHYNPNRKKVPIPEFLQPILSLKTEQIQKQEEDDSDSETSSDEVIQTPLAFPAKPDSFRNEEAASSNHSSLTRSFNSNCVKYYTKKTWHVC